MSAASSHADRGHRDLNKNGRLDPYEDPSRPIDERVDDLLGQMILAEKAGMMFHQMVMMDVGNMVFPGMLTVQQHIDDRAMNTFNILGSATAREMADCDGARHRIVTAENDR